MATPAQIARLLRPSKAPKFAGYTVVDGTWKEKGNADVTTTKDDGGTVNYMFGDGGFDAQCDIIPNKGASGLNGQDSPLLEQGGSLPETEGPFGAEVGLRTFDIIEAPETTHVNGKPVLQSVKLVYKDSIAAEKAALA